MPNSEPDLQAQAASLERRLRGLRRNIEGIATHSRAVHLDDETSTSNFRARIARAQADWETFQAVWNDREEVSLIVGVGDDFPSVIWLEHYDKLREELITAEGTLLTITRREAQTHETTALGVTLNSNSSYKSNLPKIQIPQFAGDLLKWTHFRDTFQSLVHNEPHLSNIEKFHYLLGALRGEAASLISHFPIEEGTYLQAWEALLSSYDNPRVLAGLFMDRIIECDISHIKSEQLRYQKFLTDVADSVESLKALKLERPFDFLLSTLALRALGHESRKQFELSLSPSIKYPTADDVIKFVRQRMTAIKLANRISSPQMNITSRDSREAPNRGSRKYNTRPFHQNSNSTFTSLYATGSGTSKTHNYNARSRTNNVRAATSASSSKPKCPFCQEHHLLAFCGKFMDTPRSERVAFVKAWKGCKNCLREGHLTNTCPSKWTCRLCRKPHHSLIHEDIGFSAPKHELSSKNDGPNNIVGHTCGMGEDSKGQVLLGTAQALAKGTSGYIPIRMLLDSGSQRTFVTSELASSLGLPLCPFIGSLYGIGGSKPSPPKGIINLSIRAHQDPSRHYSVVAIVLDHVSNLLPDREVDKSTIEIMCNYPISDRAFGQPLGIDVLLGNDIYPYIVTGAPQPSDVSQLLLLPTVFGLVVTGNLNGNIESNIASFRTETVFSIDKRLEKFWELEEPAMVVKRDPEDEVCERHFADTHTRTSDGRYMVKLPFKPDIDLVGANRDLALRRFLALERKLRGNHTLRDKYFEFMASYRELAHMSHASSSSSYVIPHHGVWQRQPDSSKLRVVFDASCPSTTQSLNDMLLSGPKLQLDLCSILVQFRLFAIPLCADLVKMYRQILVHPEHRRFQHVFWRDDESQQVKEFELNTVTYGLKPSAFLALRVIKQLIIDEGSNYPLAARHVSTSMYVDDLVTGADTIEEALKLKWELIMLLGEGGFSWSKWASTVPELLGESDDPSRSIAIKQPDNNGAVKILGLVWSPSSDSFTYQVLDPPCNKLTKRIVLSSIARIFDPLGFLSPVIFVAKALLQEMWRSRLGWDEDLPCALSNQWKNLVLHWNTLCRIRIPRHITSPNSSHMLVGFCDASIQGYAAAVYLRSKSLTGEIQVNLIKAKSKVAPASYMSIPRLELCATLLLARTISSLKDLPNLRNPPVCFSDSTVVLAWLRTPTHQLAVFEANRVSAVITILPSDCWHHVNSSENPADIASRGCLPEQLIDNTLWWHGPDWLTSDYHQRSTFGCNSDHTGQESGEKLQNLHSKVSAHSEWISRFSSYTFLLRTVVRMLRFARRISISKPSDRAISVSELKQARKCCVKVTQADHLPVATLSKEGPVPKSIANLSPFVDEDGIVRVGGRLDNAPICYDAKHPILLPKQSHLTNIIVDYIHQKHFHAGPTLTASLLMNEFWIQGVMKFVKGRIIRCVHCRLSKAKLTQPYMAALPKERFSCSRPFLQVGVDYAGPFHIRESKRRNAALGKAYLCVFICFATKAIHLEAVSDMTTTAFLAALDRFCARRGLPASIWSDHGSNFIGASRFMKDLHLFLTKEELQITEKSAQKGIQWKFVPPRAPHFGGLWEAAVKSVKSLLLKTMGTQPFTFEQLVTIFTKIEGFLNSRPLCPLTEDPQNNDVLTPGHFLVGGPLTGLPEVEDTNEQAPITNRWLATQAQINAIWKRWQSEYLHRLMQRAKWLNKFPNLTTGDLVILKERRNLIGRWPVARVVEIHPGKDGVVRVVSVRTPNGNVYTRAVNSMAPLFHNHQEKD